MIDNELDVEENQKEYKHKKVKEFEIKNWRKFESCNKVGPVADWTTVEVSTDAYLNEDVGKDEAQVDTLTKDKSYDATIIEQVVVQNFQDKSEQDKTNQEKITEDVVIVKEQNFTNEGPQDELFSRGDDDKCECESKVLKDNNEGPTEDECFKMKESSGEDHLEQCNSSNEEESGCKSLGHVKESEVGEFNAESKGSQEKCR